MYDFIDPQLINEIPIFENFLDRIGFKRIDGAIFGLLVLSNRPLTSEEIERTLNLSQSAVSLSLKNLIHFGAVESRVSRETRAKHHRAKENSLAIVASVFRKREHESISEFKEMAERVIAKTKDPQASPRHKRLTSLITTCELADAVIHFVFALAKVDRLEVYRPIVQQVPKALDLLLKTATPMGELALGVGLRVSEALSKPFFTKTDQPRKNS